MEGNRSLVAISDIETRILLIRGAKVLIDADLASLYGVSTKRLNEQVKPNRDRFPGDFMFQLTSKEKSEVVAICDHLSRLRYGRALPFAFTEHGTVMVASILNSRKAVEVSVFVVRAFIRLRQMISEHRQLSRRVGELDQRLSKHDGQILTLLDAMQRLLGPGTTRPPRRIGFRDNDE